MKVCSGITDFVKVLHFELNNDNDNGVIDFTNCLRISSIFSFNSMIKSLLIDKAMIGAHNMRQSSTCMLMRKKGL